ncbi:hypothetical protein DSO57_1007701 [Entomophthora muscae]|uniref:Uncharacterized protein n=1 Tax=Entomophthora muscae TaxID=34485 RepID=A0ACC2SWH5_9FUNG|nr:hypothetical protein DSO57_1007701 [Entomophthora muscae]
MSTFGLQGFTVIPCHTWRPAPIAYDGNPIISPSTEALPAQEFSKLGFVYIAIFGLANQDVPHTGGWHPWATAVSYLVRIAWIVYMAFQAWPAAPVGVQPETDMGQGTQGLPTLA